MAKVGAQRAAELTGKSKSTIQRAMKTGKLSYEMDGNDRRVVDVSELERAFGLMPQESESKDQRAVEAEIVKATQTLEMERLKMRIKMLEEQVDLTKDLVDDLKEQRDQWQKQAQQTLLTSQFSQKQAEELKEELKERERRSRIRRQQMEQRTRTVKTMRGENQNMPAVTEPSRGFDIQGLWHKIRGLDEKGHVSGHNQEDKPQKNQATA